MASSRREFLTTAAAAAGAALATSCTSTSAPFQVSLQRDSGSPQGGVPGATGIASGPNTPGVPFAIPSSMPMGSGQPLGGIGTGYVEIRADGCFYDWQIFNSGSWAAGAASTTAAPGRVLRFVLRTKKASDEVGQIRRLYLRSDENDLYSLPNIQDIEGIDYHAWFPMTGLNYRDSSLPVKVSSVVFSPFFPGSARDSATPGFHAVFTIENTSNEAVEVAVAGFLDNLLASATSITDRKLTNTVSQAGGATSILLKTEAEAAIPSGIGSMSLGVTGGEPSYIAGTYQQYCFPGTYGWNTRRMNSMLLNVLHELLANGRLPNTAGGTDPSANLPTAEQIAAFSDAEALAKVKELSTDALLARVFDDAREADPQGFPALAKALLTEVRTNLGGGNNRSTWGTAAVASTVKLAPGQKTELRFTLSWFFPHHFAAGRGGGGRRGGAATGPAALPHEMGHMYANWFKDAAEVSTFMGANYAKHRAATETFAKTLIDTTLGDAMAFTWTSQLSTLVVNTWWIKDGGYSVWEGLGCCGQSTTDVDYQGSFPITALFPELKLFQMKSIIAHMNNVGQVPHNFNGDLGTVDNGFRRVDMNPQFVMMVCRDYLWTGDKDYLAFMYPYIVRAMNFTESLDSNGDALPDQSTSLQTYDQWGLRGTPSYVASLWIGALRAAIRIATDFQKPEDVKRWSDLLAKASASFDKMLFNGEYYSLWVDTDAKDELCMSDQISGEWFSHLIGLPTTISEKNLGMAVDAIVKYNFNPEFGLHNATAPRKGRGLITITNLQAGGVWSGIEFAFASFLMDHGRYAAGVKVVEAVHRRYLRAGMPWNHVECGGHYSRAMSSWATMLAATGFKPDWPNKTLAVIPTAPGDFRCPWATATGCGTISRTGKALSITCTYGTLGFQSLKLDIANATARLGAGALAAKATAQNGVTTLAFAAPVSLAAGQTVTIQ